MNRLEDMRRAALEYSLSRTPIFAGLPTEDLRRLSNYSVLKSLPRGAYLFRQKDPIVGFFVVRQGVINVHRINAEGREQIIHLLRTGDSFAERALVLNGGYPANAQAVEDSEVILIPIEDFKNHQRKQPDLAWRMVASMGCHLRSLVATLEGLRFKDIETRFIYWLLQRCPTTTSDQPVEIVLGTTKGQLASELATRQETLSRIFRKLRALGYIEVLVRSLIVLNPSTLQHFFDQKAHMPIGSQGSQLK